MVSDNRKINGKDLKSLLTYFYRKVHSLLPNPIAENVSECVYLFTKKPYIHFDTSLHPRNRLKRGVVVISIDFELSWAWQYARSADLAARSRTSRERAQIPILVSLFDEYKIPVTWATVGHLFLKSCSRDCRGIAHSEMPRREHFVGRYWEFTSGDWFQHDPCSDAKADPGWYGPDLIEAILAAQTEHEFGCHGFSHLGFGPNCPQEVAAAELDACLHAMEPYGLRPLSFVFPGNEAGNFDVLRQKGFRTVRSYPLPWAELSLPILCNDGLWHVHASASVEKGVDPSACTRHLLRLLRYVQKAAQTRLAAHFWLHPSLSPVQIEHVLRPLVRYCAEQRSAGRIDVLTIDQLVGATERESLKN